MGLIAKNIPAWEVFLNFSISFSDFLLICPAICGIWFLSKTDHEGSVYVINLLIFDIFHIFAWNVVYLVSFLALEGHFGVGLLVTLSIYCGIYLFSFFASIGFVILIAAERYLVIVYPILYRAWWTRKCFLCSSIQVWMSPFFIDILSVVVYGVSGRYENILFGVGLLCLLPLPLLVSLWCRLGEL